MNSKIVPFTHFTDLFFRTFWNLIINALRHAHEQKVNLLLTREWSYIYGGDPVATKWQFKPSAERETFSLTYIALIL